jgi:hypothetical protein
MCENCQRVQKKSMRYKIAGTIYIFSEFSRPTLYTNNCDWCILILCEHMKNEGFHKCWNSRLVLCLSNNSRTPCSTYNKENKQEILTGNANSIKTLNILHIRNKFGMPKRVNHIILQPSRLDESICPSLFRIFVWVYEINRTKLRNVKIWIRLFILLTYMRQSSEDVILKPKVNMKRIFIL